MPVFCCDNLRDHHMDDGPHKSKFDDFKEWASFPKEPEITQDKILPEAVPYVFRVIREFEFEPLLYKRYFVKLENGPLVEVDEDWLPNAGFWKLKAFENFVCDTHDNKFTLNIFMKVVKKSAGDSGGGLLGAGDNLPGDGVPGEGPGV